MPTIRVFDVKVRVQPLLNAIAAQEWLEHVFASKPSPVHGPSRMAAWERDKTAAARSRNGAERRLRPDEHLAWEKWRAGDANIREAARAVLTDLPPARLR